MLEEFLYLDSLSHIPPKLARDFGNLSEEDKVNCYQKLCKEIKKWNETPEASTTVEGKIWIEKLERLSEFFQPFSDHSLRGRIRFNKNFLKDL